MDEMAFAMNEFIRGGEAFFTVIETSAMGEDGSAEDEEAFMKVDEAFFMVTETSSMGEDESAGGEEASIKDEEAFTVVMEAPADAGLTSLGWPGSEMSSTASVSPAAVIGMLSPVQFPQPNSS